MTSRSFWHVIDGTKYRIIANEDTGAIERVSEWDEQRMFLIDRPWDALSRELHYEITSHVLCELAELRATGRIRDLGENEGAVHGEV